MREVIVFAEGPTEERFIKQVVAPALHGLQIYLKPQLLKQSLHDAVVEHVGCRPDRFLPHIQPYEYEGLLFSDVNALAATEPTWVKASGALRKVRESFDSPEHINDGYETKPSKRLENLLHPKYKKTIHGPRAAARISLETMERECAHFQGWMNLLRGLAQTC